MPVEAALDGVAHGGGHCQPQAGPRAGARARWQCAATAPPTARPGGQLPGALAVPDKRTVGVKLPTSSGMHSMQLPPEHCNYTSENGANRKPR